MAGSMRALLYARERLEEVTGMLDQPPMPDDVLGVVAEIGIEQGAVMVAGYANGDARLLFTMGGGLLGDLYQFPNIAEAAKTLCAIAQSLVGQMPVEKNLPPLPTVDNVRMAVLTTAHQYASEAPGPEIIQPAHPLQKAFAAATRLFEELQALQDSANSKPQ